MPTEVKIEDLRDGDTVDVLLKGVTVKLDLDDRNHPLGLKSPKDDNRFEESWLSTNMLADAVITRHDPPIEAGDVVRVADYVHAYSVIAVHRDIAWLDTPSLVQCLYSLSDLTLISKGPAK